MEKGEVNLFFLHLFSFLLGLLLVLHSPAKPQSFLHTSGWSHAVLPAPMRRGGGGAGVGRALCDFQTKQLRRRLT